MIQAKIKFDTKLTSHEFYITYIHCTYIVHISTKNTHLFLNIHLATFIFYQSQTVTNVMFYIPYKCHIS